MTNAITSSRTHSQLLEEVKSAIRKAPTKPEPRLCYFQLLCMTGNYHQALCQLGPIKAMSPEHMVLIDILPKMVKAEEVRSDVFSGKVKPSFFGEQYLWMNMLQKALILDKSGKQAEAWELRSKARDNARTATGTVNDTEFEWITNGDERLGPQLEVIINGTYGWLAFESIQTLKAEAPKDLGDLMWQKATIILKDGRTLEAVLPVRYPSTETCDDNDLVMAAKTTWDEVQPNCYTGLGQHMFYTDNAEFSLLEVRDLHFHTV